MSRTRKWALILAVLLISAGGVAYLVHRALPSASVGTTFVGQESPPSPAGASYVVDFATDDPVAAANQIKVITSGSLSAPVGVQQGFLTQGAATSPTAASYFFRNAGATPDRVGIEFLWPGDSGGADRADRAVAILLTNGPLPLVQTGARPDAPVHFVVTETSWQLGTFPASGQLKLIGQRPFRSRSFDGALRFELRFDGPTVTVVQPDGKLYTVTSPEFDQPGATWIGWELFQARPGIQSPGIARWWSD